MIARLRRRAARRRQERLDRATEDACRYFERNPFLDERIRELVATSIEASLRKTLGEMRDTQPAFTAPANQCKVFDTHYGSGLPCQGQEDHDGPHFHGGATWPDGEPLPTAKRKPTVSRLGTASVTPPAFAPTVTPKASGDLPTPTKLKEAGQAAQILDALPAGYKLIRDAAEEAGVSREVLHRRLAANEARIIRVRGMGKGHPKPAAPHAEIARALDHIQAARRS